MYTYVCIHVYTHNAGDDVDGGLLVLARAPVERGDDDDNSSDHTTNNNNNISNNYTQYLHMNIHT